MTAPHHRSYDPIESVVLDDTLLADLVVTARIDRGVAAPFGLVIVDRISLGLTPDQVDTLIAQLQRAREDVRRGPDEEFDDGE